MEDFIAEVLGESILADILEVAGDVLLDTVGMASLMSSDIALEGVSALTEAGLELDVVSLFGDTGIAETGSSTVETIVAATSHHDNTSTVYAASNIIAGSEMAGVASFNEGIYDSSGLMANGVSETVQIRDPFSDLDNNGLRDSLQIGGLDLDASGISDRIEMNTDIDANGVADGVQFGLDVNQNGLADQYDISVDSDGNGVFDSVQSTAFDLDGNGIKDISTYEELIKIKSGITPNWF